MKHSNVLNNEANEVKKASPGSSNLELLFPSKDWLTQLDRLLLISNAKMRGMLAGKRRSSQVGSSLDFADYRSYVPGDDIRRLDWKVYGRTNKAVIRQYWDEQERAFHIYIDASRSMTTALWDNANKYQFTVQLAASIAYIALQSDDRVTIKQFSDKGIEESLNQVYGKGAVQRLFTALASALKQRLLEANDYEGQMNVNKEAIQELDMLQAFHQGSALPVKAGVTWLITDGLYDQGFEQLLAKLRARQQEVVVVLIMHQEELEPQLAGELKLIDIELRSSKEVAISSGIIARYREELHYFLDQLKLSCGRYDVPLYMFNSSESFADQFMQQFIQQQQIRTK